MWQALWEAQSNSRYKKNWRKIVQDRRTTGWPHSNNEGGTEGNSWLQKPAENPLTVGVVVKIPINSKIGLNFLNKKKFK